MDSQELKDSLASGMKLYKQREGLNQMICWQVVLGIICVGLGVFETIPIGLALLILTIWARARL